MATMTIAQARASSDTGIVIADTPANIAAALSNTALVARVSQFTMNGNGAIWAAAATQLAGLGSRFSTGGNRLIVRDTAANLTDPDFAAGVALGTVYAFYDHAEGLLSVAGTIFASHANSAVLSASASLTLAQLISLETLPGFSVLPGQIVTLADSAANLLALTPQETKAALKAFTVSVDSSVDISTAATLFHLPSFAVANGTTLTVTGPFAAMTDSAIAATLAGYAAMPGVALQIGDSLTTLLAHAGGIATFAQNFPGASAAMADFETISAATLLAASSLPHFSVAPGGGFILADIAANLLALPQSLAGMAVGVNLTSSATVSVAQLAALVALPSFVPTGGAVLTIEDSLVALNAMSGAELAVAGPIVVLDTVADLLAASSLPTGTARVVAQIDGGTYTAAQAQALLALSAHLTLIPAGSATTLHIADTAQHLTAAASALATLQGDGPVTLTATDGGTFTGSVLSAVQASAYTGATSGLSVTDTGANLTAFASQVFGRGFTGITVSSGVFAGTKAQLLDPTLHFADLSSAGTLGVTIVQASAQLMGATTASVAQLISLAILPNFSLASGATLTVSDTMAAMIPHAGLIGTYATAVGVTDSETVTAAGATALAAIKTAVGFVNFSLNGHTVTVSDDGANIAGTANAAGIALAGSVTLSVSSVVTAAQTATLIGLGSVFSPNGMGLTVQDTAAALAGLSASVLNGWHAQVQLTADATLNVAGLQALLGFTGFSAGTHRIGLSDTAANLLASGAAAAETVASTVALSQPATVTVAQAGALLALHGFSANGQAVTVADTPAHLAAMGLPVAALAGTEALVARTSGNAADYTISAAQFSILLGLSNLSVAGFVNAITVTDTAAALTALAPTIANAATGSLPTHVVPVLSADATVSAAIANTLAHMANFGLGGHVLAVLDTPAGLLASGVAPGLSIAGSVGLLAPVTVSATTANALAALPGIAADANPLTVADTPAGLLTLTSGALALAAQEQIVPLTGLNAAGFTLTEAQLVALTQLPNLVFSGPIAVVDTAANLVLLEAMFAAASPGSALLAAQGASHATLSADATVSASSMQALAALPGFATGAHVLTVSDTPTALLAAPTGALALASGATLTATGAPWTLTAGMAEAIATLPHFSAGAGYSVSDSVANLLAPANAAGLAAASSVTPNNDATVNAVQAIGLHGISGFTAGTHHLTIVDGAVPLTLLDAGTAATAFAIDMAGNGIVSVAQLALLAALPNFSKNGASLTVADTAANLLTLTRGTIAIDSTVLAAPATVTADQAETLSTLPHFTGSGLSIADTAANLVRVASGIAPADLAGELLASSISLTADATIATAQATLLDLLGGRFSNGGHMLTIADTAAHLAAGGNWSSIASQITGYALTSAATVSAATAETLASLPNFSAGPGMTVSDSVANLLAPANAAGLAVATAVTIDANVTVAAWQATALHTIAGFTAGTHTITIADSAKALATLDAGTAALAIAIDLADDSVVSVARLQALQALPNFSTDGHVLTVSDTAANLLTLVSGGISPATAAILRANATLTADQAESLTTLPGFGTGTAHVAISDSVANLLHVTGSGPLPDDWAGELVATAIALTGDATVTAAQAEELSALGGRLILGGHTLTVSDTAANLLNPADTAGLALAATVTLSGDDTVTAARATALTGIAGFAKGANIVTVSDTAASLALPANAAGIALADRVQLSVAASLSVAAAESLIGLANFQTNGTAALAIADSLTHLLGLGSASLPHNNAILQATAIGLSEDATATVAQMNTLALLPEFAQFSLNGHALTVMDSGRHLAAYTVNAGAVPTEIDLIGDATLTAAQANHLAAIGALMGDNVLTVADTPTNLLSGANAAGIALASVLTLSGNATASASQATLLFGNPDFNTGGHVLTIEGTAASLLGLGSDIDTRTGTLALVASETVDVATLLGLTELGTRFSLNGHILTVADTAAHLANLNTLETHLASGEVLNASATVNAATAEILATLPNFSETGGATLTIVDTVANLSALSGAAQAIATGETLTPGASVTLTVAQAQGLAALNAFSNTGATIVVSDTFAHLNTGGWQSVATSYDVTDSVAHIVANASAPLLTNAASVVLAGDSVIDTTTVDTLAGIANFTRGTAALVVADSPDAIADHATAILTVASAARIISSSSLTAAQAEELVPLANASELTFSGSNHLVVADTFAHLSDAANAGGVALASVIDVTDTAANLVTAAAHDWGSVAPFYILTAGGTVTGAGATVLAGLGSHYNNSGFTLTMADTAANVVANGAALTSLAIEAAVTDSIANIDANVAGLLSLGAHLASVTPTDTGAVSADAAAGLHTLVAVLAGSPVNVSDTAAHVVADSGNLLALGAHLGTITLTDTSPVAVAVATGLLPLVADLAGGTSIDVSDTGAAIAAQASGLAALGSDLGTVALSDGTATDAATAAALVPIQAHLGGGVQLSITDTAAHIDAASAGLATMIADSRISGIVAANETVAHVLAHGSALVSLGATATISDTAAHVNAALDGLEAIHAVVTSIALTDGTTPTIAVSVAQLGSDHAVLSAITSPYHLTVSDTAAHIQADLTGGSSAILGDLADLTGIVVSDSGTVALTEAQVLAAGVDDGAGSAMALLSGGTLVVTGVAAADAGIVAGLGVPPASMTIADTAANIQADLTSGSSELVAERALISSITATGGGAISLTEAQATAAHVDDGAGSVFAKLTGATLTVTGVPVADIATVAALPVAPTAIAVSDTAAHVQADLIAGGSRIIGHQSAVASIDVNDSGTITFTVAQIEAAGVETALAKTTGETLVVTGAAVSDLSTIAGLAVVPSSIAVTDTAADIQADLASGSSAILAERSLISGITVNPAGTVTLTQAQVLTAGVDDGAGSALALMTGETLVVTHVDVAHIATVLGLGVPPASIAVSDTAAHIQADLGSGSSVLVGNIGSVTGITVNDSGTISLTVAQIEAAGVDDGAGSVLAETTGGTIVVTGAAVSDIATLAGLGVVPHAIDLSDSAADVDADLTSGASDILAHIATIGAIALTDAGTPALGLTLAQLAASHAALALIDTPYSLAISDTAAHLQADLTSGSSALLAHRTGISSIAVSDAGNIALTQTQVLAAHMDDGAGSVFSVLSGGGLIVTGVTVAETGTVVGLPFAPTHIALSDTAAHIQADLIAGTSAILTNLATIAGIAVSDAGTIHLTEAQIEAAGVDDGAGSALSLLTGGTIDVTGVPVADIATVLALGVPPDTIHVSDTAADLQADLTGGSSELLAHRSVIAGIVVSDSGTITLTVAQAEAAHVDSGAGSILSKMTGETLAVTGVAVSDIATLEALSVPPSRLAISDTAAHIQADLASGASKLVANVGTISGIAVSDSGTVTLTQTQALAAHVDDGAGSVFALLSGGDLVVTHVTTAEIGTILALPFAPTTIAVSDTAAHIQADLAGGSSAILANLADIAGIAVSPAGTIVLTEAQLQAAGVDDGAGSAFAKMTGETLAVTGVPIADIGTMLALGVPPDSIAVSDTAANIEADLTGGSSVLVAQRSAISAIAANDSGTITLTVAQIEAAHVDDGAGSVFAKMTGETLHVTGALVSDIGTLGALSVAPTGLSISDTAAHIQADLTSGSSQLAANLSLIGAITVSDAGTITLTATQLLAAHVDDGPASVLALTSGGSLAVTHVTAAQLPMIGALTVAPDSFAVADTAANLQADLVSGSPHILAYLGAISAIAVSPAGTITLTEAQVLGASVDDFGGSALAKMTGLTLYVTGVAVADIGTILALGVPPSSIAVSDTAANIQADLTGGSSAILANLSSIGGIAVSFGGAIELTIGQAETSHIDDGAGSVFSKLTGGTLTVTGVAVSDIDTVATLPVAPTTIYLSDTAAHIQADLASGSSHIVAHLSLIGGIAVSDSGTITLTETQLRAIHIDDAGGSALAQMTGETLAVTHVLAADVAIVAALDVPPNEIGIIDTAAHIQADLTSGSSGILANLSAITGIAVSPAGTITLTAAQAAIAGMDDGAGSALALMTGATLHVTGVTAALLPSIAGLFVTPASIAMSDTAAHIQADLAAGGASAILANLGLIGSIAVSPAGTITLTDAQVQFGGVDDGAGSALSLMTGETLVVTGVPVADIATIMGLGVAPSHITVVDSEANLIADLTGGSSVIAANASAITGVTPTDATLAVADATDLYNALLGVATLNESGLTITGTAADLLTAHTGVPAMLTAAHAVTMTGNPTGLTAAQATTLSSILGGHLGGGQTLGVSDTAAHLLDSANAAGIALATTVQLSVGILSSASYVTLLADLHGFTAGAAIVVADTVAHLLDSANADGLAAASTVEVASDVTVTAAQLTSLSGIANFTDGGHAITVADTAAAIAALGQPALGFSSLAAVTDTSANVQAALNNLQSVVTGHSHALSIALSDGVAHTPSITVTAATYGADAATIDTITTAGAVRVIGTAAQLAALSSSLAADTVVGEVDVTDSAANILSNLTALNGIGAKFSSATITDATLNASYVSSLLTIPNLHASSLTIADTGAQLAATIQSGGASALTFLNAHTVQLTANSVVTASQALSLESLTALQKGSYTLVAWDTASHLTDSIDGYLAAVSAGIIDGVYLKTVGGTATVSASTAAALFSIPRFSKNNPDSSTNTLTVQDTAAHLESAFAALNAHKTAVSGIVVSASTTVTDAVYGDLLTLGATASFGASLTVRDTAANIIANAPSQVSGSPSLTPTTWSLSGSATVTIAGAAFLGGLTGFSPGASTLTIGANGSATVTQANQLGSLGATLHLGGHTVGVAGSVATVSGLSGAAKPIVVTAITDTFANIATLTIASGLLTGTLTITDSASPTVAQANAFLALLLAGGNGGIPIAAVSFGGHTEAITDTLANIQTMTGSAGWTSNAAVHADFTLVAADTVAHLIDPANTAALEALAGTTLSSNQTTTAANAESLVNLSSSIHFSLGGHTVTIQDTAANILNPSNADGEAIATAWNLSGNDTVAAADAETLLTSAKFSVNGHTLTISDSSDNLLDGVLSGDISGFSGVSHVHVQLAGAETLDAQTAAALVALPGFTNNGDLSIQDSSDYLLNAANHTAEVDATSVTLVGDETVSVATAVALAAVPNFTLGSATLHLATNDYANAAAVTALADFGSGFDANGHTITLTQDALSLTPTEYAAVQSDNIVLNGHALSALATGIGVTSGGGTVHVSGNGVDGATLNVYASSGASLSQTAGVSAAFTADAAEGSIGNGVVVTETVGASAATSESAPIIALEQTVLTDAATADSATFAGSGSVQVGVGQYVNLYTTANAPVAPANPVLVYDATAHTLSLDITGHAPLVLVTLGSATHPASLDPSEIVVKHFT